MVAHVTIGKIESIRGMTNDMATTIIAGNL